MIRTIIFDLSEVLIAGLVGIEKPLAARLDIPEDTVLTAFGGDLLRGICCGLLSEDTYLTHIIGQQQWRITPAEVKQIIRRNFHQRVPGMQGVPTRLATVHDLTLLSDHAAEWVTYIKTIHPFLDVFAAQFYSFELKRMKSDPSTFHVVLAALNRQPEECLLIDDSATNVAVAAAVGLSAIRFTTAEELLSKLKGLDLL
jgi:FMN phosphatase YigB (HAD superfamily)